MRQNTDRRIEWTDGGWCRRDGENIPRKVSVVLERARYLLVWREREPRLVEVVPLCGSGCVFRIECGLIFITEHGTGADGWLFEMIS